MNKFDKNGRAYLDWVENPFLDENMRQDILNASDEELTQAFINELEFGTAGIRGVMGFGPGHFNIYTIKKVIAAYAHLLINKYPDQIEKERGVVIGHDNRYNSEQYAKIAAEILTSFGIKAYLFKDNSAKPTPVVSYATKYLKCLGGIVITASHNPAKYNGCKIYDEYGCQLQAEETDLIVENMSTIMDIISWTYKAVEDLLVEVPHDVIESYFKMVSALQFYPKDKKDNFKVVYSNVNGTGAEFVPHVLKQAGYDVILVPEHLELDPLFANVGNPNPEFDPAWVFPIKTATEHNADLIILTDPDADRLAIAVKFEDKYVRLNGNETGALLIDWKLGKQQEFKRLPKNPALYSSFVTSDLGDRIAKEKYNATIVKTLTGFKWMGREILKEKERNLNFVFAYEESIGYVLDNSTLDKDGVQAAIMACEMSWFYLQHENKTLIDKLDDLYKEFGCYYTHTINLEFQPDELKSKIDPIMKKLRAHPPISIGGSNVVNVEDYIVGLYNMPGQNLMKFYLENKSWIAIRPSGTEPKIKIYFIIVANDIVTARELYTTAHDELQEYLEI